MKGWVKSMEVFESLESVKFFRVFKLFNIFESQIHFVFLHQTTLNFIKLLNG